jgi:hypothetical protein
VMARPQKDRSSRPRWTDRYELCDRPCLTVPARSWLAIEDLPYGSSALCVTAKSQLVHGLLGLDQHRGNLGDRHAQAGGPGSDMFVLNLSQVKPHELESRHALQEDG